MAEAGTMRKDDGGLKEALRQARIAEAAHYEAALQLRDSKTIRLQLLKDDLDVAAAAADGFVDLALEPGDPPKLWIDLITHVVMEPDHRTYRLQQDQQAGREVLLETDDRAAMTEAIKKHMAHQMVIRERQAAGAIPSVPVAGHSAMTVVLAVLSGAVLGAALLMLVAMSLGWMDF